MDKRNTFIEKDGEILFAGAKITDLVKEYKTPTYFYDENKIEKMCSIFTNSLNKFYGLGSISYASKAFCCKEIYRLIKKFDMTCDVVSCGEIATAISANFDTKKLFFHGNNKNQKDLDFAIDNGIGYIVIDSYSEADKIENICSRKNIIQNVLIRVNPGIEAHTHKYIQTSKTDSKFGFSIDSGEATSFINFVKTKKHINLKGLHCHIGSQIFDENSFILTAQKMIEFYVSLKNQFNYDFDILDLGGGIGIWYADGDKEFSNLDYENFIKNICEKVNDIAKSNNIKKPYLIFEPGRSIVGEAGITLYTAGSPKYIKNVRNYLPIDGGMGDNPRFILYEAKYTILNLSKYDKKPDMLYSVCGKYCESGDMIAKDIMLPKTEEGDIIAVLSTGAYHYSMACNYNRNVIPPVVFVKDGVSRYVVKPQTLDDILRNDI